jgi:hypothetical protein
MEESIVSVVSRLDMVEVEVGGDHGIKGFGTSLSTRMASPLSGLKNRHPSSSLPGQEDEKKNAIGPPDNRRTYPIYRYFS